MKRSFLNIAGAAALASGMLMAQTAPPTTQPQPQTRAGKGRAQRANRMAFLNLTEAQKTQAKAIREEANREAEPVRAKLKQDRIALGNAMKSNASEAEIQRIENEMKPLVSQLIDIRSTSFAKFYGILTPEQRAKLGTRVEEFKGMHGMHGGMAAPPTPSE